MDLFRIMDEVSFTAVRSRGPGGQNVNKVSSAALLFWNFENSSAISSEERQLIREKLTNSVNKEGEVFVRSDEFRDLERNKARCFEKLEEMLRWAFFKPKPRKATKPTKASRRKRVEGKRRRGEIKKSRSNKDW